MTLALFNWSRTPDGAQLATWGRYSAILAHHRSGAWTADIYHGPRRGRHEELDPGLTLSEARGVAEQFLLDEQGPEVRELVRRARAAEGRGAGTVSLRAVGGASGGKRRKAMGKKAKRGAWRVTIYAKPGKLLLGGVKRVSGSFSTRSEAQAYADAMRDQPNAQQTPYITGPSTGVSGKRRRVKPELKSGYGYVASGVSNWHSEPDDSWDTIPITSDGKSWAYKPKFVGYRMIDGTRCAVFETRPGDYYAQTAVYAGGGKKRHASGKRRHPASRLGALVSDINRLVR